MCLYAKNKGLTKICVFGLVALCVQLWLVYLCKALLFTILSVFMFRHVCVVRVSVLNNIKNVFSSSLSRVVLDEIEGKNSETN